MLHSRCATRIVGTNNINGTRLVLTSARFDTLRDAAGACAAEGGLLAGASGHDISALNVHGEPLWLSPVR
jgi:hypothetical protein